MVTWIFQYLTVIFHNVIKILLWNQCRLGNVTAKYSEIWIELDHAALWDMAAVVETEWRGTDSKFGVNYQTDTVSVNRYKVLFQHSDSFTNSVFSIMTAL